MIDYIENGMELSKVREIINEIISKVNEFDKVTNSYNDLTNKPAIDGTELTEKSTMKDFKIDISQLSNFEQLEKSIIEITAQKAVETATAAVAGKLDSNFSVLPQLNYNLNEKMTVIINTDKGELLRTTLGDLILYLKHEIIKIDSQYLRVIH